MTPEQRAVWMAGRTKHGGYLGGKEQPEHYIWRSMLARCNNLKNAAYAYYGGRGIKVCPQWHTYEVFLSDMGPRPSPSYSIERRNTNGGYEPSNCYWATRSEQQKNKTTTRIYTDGHFTGTLVECANYVGIGKELAHWRWKQYASFIKGQTWHELPKPL